MNSTPVWYNAVVGLHALAALVSLLAMLRLRFGARALAGGALDAVNFSQRRTWPLRFFHVLIVTGVLMVASGDGVGRWSATWVIAGLVLYALAAGHLEARTLPQVRTFANLEPNAVSAAARRLVLSVDVLSGLWLLAAVAMFTKF